MPVPVLWGFVYRFFGTVILVVFAAWYAARRVWNIRNRRLPQRSAQTMGSLGPSGPRVIARTRENPDR